MDLAAASGDTAADGGDSNGDGVESDDGLFARRPSGQGNGDNGSVGPATIVPGAEALPPLRRVDSVASTTSSTGNSDDRGSISSGSGGSPVPRNAPVCAAISNGAACAVLHRVSYVCARRRR